MNYRKIWEKHNGPIPKDNMNRTYHIHHIDGNHSNNSIENLQCVTPQEHYDIHYAQGDWGACLRMSSKLKLSGQEISELARKNTLNMIKEGTNAFVGGEIQRKSNIKRIEEGTHPFIQPGFSKYYNEIRIKNGTHNFLGDGSLQRSIQLKRIEKGTNPLVGINAPSQQKWICEYCNKEGKGKGNYTRFHGDNCRYKENKKWDGAPAHH